MRRREPAGGRRRRLPRSDVRGVMRRSGRLLLPRRRPREPLRPITFDIGARTGEPSPLTISGGGSVQETVTVRARIFTEMALPMTASGHNCTLVLATAPGPTPDVQLTVTVINFEVGATSYVNVHGVSVSGLTTADFNVIGD